MSDSPAPPRPPGRADLAGTLLDGRYRFGPYPFPSYTVVVTEDPLEIPLEAQAMATFGESHVDGRYRSERLIATGGMAQVWEGTDTGGLSRPVAIKLLHAHLADDQTFVERFRREAIAVANLNHPGIIPIYDIHSGDGMEAIVMELVHGVTLRQELDRRHSLPPAEAVRIGVQVADALAAAHLARLVHRDIKPANILLSEDDRVMVADFGIAKLAEGADHTQEGTMLGTAKYLAPEQVDGRPVDARTDVYALGVVLYEMLCGRPPFAADTDVATALARLHGDPPRPRQIKADIPRALDDLVMRALAREPDGRFATAAELRMALQTADLGAPDPVTYEDNTAITTATPPRGTPALAGAAGGTGGSVGAKGGAAEGSATPAPTTGFVRSERSILFPALIVIFVALALAVAGVLIGNTLADRGIIGGTDTTDATTPTTTPAATEVAVTTATPFDPEIGDGENDDAAPRAIDDDPASTWVTSTYVSTDFGGLKDGLGLILTLDQAAELASLTVDSPTGGWTADIYVADQAAPDLAGWGEPVVTGQNFGEGETVVDLSGATGSEVLIWITVLADGGNVAIADATVAAA